MHWEYVASGVIIVIAVIGAIYEISKNPSHMKRGGDKQTENNRRVVDCARHCE